MKSQGTAPYLARTRLVDHDHPAIAATVVRVTAGAHDDVTRAVRLHDFVRDEMLFGWTPQFDSQKASEVLVSGVGFCHTKSTLLTALLRAAGIPARIQCVTIHRGILGGLIRPPSRFVDHSFVEVSLNNRWMGIDSYTIDPALHCAALARCRAEQRTIGYGIHTRGSIHWDGQSSCFSQFLDDGSVRDLSDARFGSYVDLDAFRATGLGRNPTHIAGRLLIRALTRAANRRVHRLRTLGWTDKL
jgi:hypothetical protein